MRKTEVATGRRKGFWNLLMDSRKGTVMRPTGTAAMESTPRSLLGITRSALKVGKKYHSGRISRGVAKGSAGSPSWGLHDREADGHGDGTEDHDREDVEEVVGHAGSP